MNYNIEKNLLKTIMMSFLVIMSAMILAISFFYLENTQDNLKKQMKNYENEYYKEIKETLKMRVTMVTDILDYNIAYSNLTEQEQKEYAIKLLSNLTFEQKKSNYIFIYEVVNFEGGDNFAKMLVNPNRPDLSGKFISTNEEDVNGKKFRKEFLENIIKTGESYTSYSYKKPDSKNLIYKLSYFKFYPKYNWIVAVGIYTDDIENELNIKKEEQEQEIKKQISQNIILFLLFFIIAILISMAISNEIYKILKDYRQKVDENEKELKILNKSLEEMMSNIAHQWRQPLAEISSILMLIKLKYDTNRLDKDSMKQKLKEANMVLEYMSNTIDDFRGFFSTNKEKEKFYLSELIDSVITINSTVLRINNIQIDVNIDKNIELETYLNEYQQVVLNILKNAKDVLIEKDIKKPLIKIYSLEDKNSISLIIEDNGGGINIEPLNKIFEAYYSSKSQSKGTGIGLYMSKMIVEKSLKGILSVENSNFGAKFSIILEKEIKS
ncbi:cache domain-containing protein [Arcobacter lacus]|uniref:cache domain-containing protein n=1 Tax=Arcobacter lacus TaxID=1912876 RepID=UPI0021BA91A5|nr:cache domain-containing protein [Arcobacter lacus]MCT7910052.1 cache domain-containing protein [Arcobacter lacus]